VGSGHHFPWSFSVIIGKDKSNCLRRGIYRVADVQHLFTRSVAVLLSSRPGLGLEDPRGHLMKVLALALDDKVLAPQVLALTLREKSWPWPGQDFFSKIQATCYVYALLTLTVSHNSLQLLAQRNISQTCM